MPRLNKAHAPCHLHASEAAAWSCPPTGVAGGIARQILDTAFEHNPPATFGFAAAIHTHHPDTGWFVPSIMDEMRIPADGRSGRGSDHLRWGLFDELTGGRAQSRAYDSTFRHALDVGEDGEVLAFGTTTGSMGLSDGRGHSWHASQISYLPYAAADS